MPSSSNRYSEVQIPVLLGHDQGHGHGHDHGHGLDGGDDDDDDYDGFDDDDDDDDDDIGLWDVFGTKYPNLCSCGFQSKPGQMF